MEWERHAAALADGVALPPSRWHRPVAEVPRHVFLPRWWDRAEDGWTVRDGREDEQAWMATAYSDRSIVTEVAGRHADHEAPGTTAHGWSTSSSTAPSLVTRMYRLGHLSDGADVLDVGTGSGYGAGLLTHRFGDERVTTIDVDPYLTKAAAERLDQLGLHPTVLTSDAAGELPGTYDRIVAMVSVRPIPASWLTALRPGGRLVAVITGTSLVLTAEKVREGSGEKPGWAVGRIEWERATFMASRPGPGAYPADQLAEIRDADGEHVSRGRYPVLDVTEAWDVGSMLELTVPGVQHRYERGSDGLQTAWMTRADGSWARATGEADEVPTVHQSGPVRLWDELDAIRHYWVTHGELPVRGAKAIISPEGTIHLARGNWRVSIAY